MKQFLQKVWGTQEGYAYVGAKNHNTGDWYQHPFKYPEQLDEIEEKLGELNKTSSIYFCPHLFASEGRRVKDNSLPTKHLWVDKDAGSLAELEPRPTLCWQTSEGKWQALWKLNDPIELEKAEMLNKKLIKYTRGDKGGWAAGKYLRIPESVNHKYKPPYHGILLWEDGPTYEPLEFVRLKDLDDFEEVKVELDQLPPIPKKLPTFQEAVTTYGKKIPSAAWSLLQEDPKRKDDWSDKIWKLESLLIKAGIPKEHVYAIVADSPWNKYKRDGRPDEHLWREICKAELEKDEVTPEDDMEDLPWMSLDSLMLYAEKPQWLVEDIWMEKNVGWIAGEGKSYKSIMSLDLALSVASGKPFLNKFPVKDPGPVLMVQEEDPIWRVAHRIQVMSDAKGIVDIDVAHRNGNLVLNMKNTNIPLFLSIGGKLTFEDEDRMDALERAIASRRPKMVILDPMFMLAAGMDEFKAGEMAGLLNKLKQWRNEYDCSIAVVHHYRKSTGADTQKLYGSMALYAWSENSLLVQRESRDRNIVSIRRDIKDAPSDDKLSVEFLDIDGSYDFLFKEAGTPGDNDVLDAVRYSGKSEPVTVKNIMDLTGMSERAVRSKVAELKKEGLIEVDRRGRGGVLQITPVSTYKEGFDELV